MLTHSDNIQADIQRLGWKAAESADYVATGAYPDEKTVRDILGVQHGDICVASLSDDVHFVYVGDEESVANRLGVDMGNPYSWDDADEFSWDSDE